VNRVRGQIVFATAPYFGASADLYVVNANGSHLRQLTRGPASEENPDWSPDGRSIVYINAGGARRQAPGLYRIAANGSGRRVFFTGDEQIDNPAWSPDGRRVAFSCTRSRKLEIWTYSLTGRRLKQITHDGLAVQPTWSPNGKRLAYIGFGPLRQARLVVSAADGTKKRSIPNAFESVDSPIWSPNGRWIALRATKAGGSNSLVLVTPTGTVRKTLVRGGLIFPADWSPSGDAVLFLRKSRPTSERAQLFIVSVSGGKPRPVRGTQGAVGSASWRP
jgi:TolB protein